jgi:uncharacterized protein
MTFKKHLIGFSLIHPRLMLVLSSLVTLFFLLAFPNIRTDTDPVKMLAADNPAVLLYDQMKKEFRLSDMIVVGIHDPTGASLFTVDRLKRIHKITNDILNIQIKPPTPLYLKSFFKSLQQSRTNIPNTNDQKKLIVKADVLSPSTVDDIILNQKNELNVIPLMKNPPKSETEAQKLLTTINSNAILRGKLASQDGSLIGIFLPLEKGKKGHSYQIGNKIKEIMKRHLIAGELYYLAGLPIAETTFGTEMFVQMAIYAPIAGILIFILLLFFFRDWRMVSGAMILAVMTVIWSMGGLIYSGNPVHIMSSMIPIFLMPIALLDSIHIISHINDFNRHQKSSFAIIWQVMSRLFNPMLFTSLTTMVGFFSLSVTGIQPVEVFGITIGLGVMIAWLLSMTFLPAYLLLVPSLKKHQLNKPKFGGLFHHRFLKHIPVLSKKYPKQLVGGALILMIFSLIGIRMITINDNPIRWFKSNHELRQSDQIMNKKLAGTYMANLIFELRPIIGTQSLLQPLNETELFDFEEDPFEMASNNKTVPDLKDSGLIRYIGKIQSFLHNVQDHNGEKIVGATTSIVDILRKVGRIAMQDPEIPVDRQKIAQYLFLYESGDIDKGRDIWKFITMDYQKAQIWLQLKNGDNQVMKKLMNELDQYLENPANQLPVLESPSGNYQLVVKWSGLTYLNNVWQNEMVKGMGFALVGSFIAVFIMMSFLFRSTIWAFVSMVPLSLSISLIYGFIGWTGKYYDMPIAVLSCLALGLSIDFAIHFNQSLRDFLKKSVSLNQSMENVFKEPCSAICKNVFVISIGFTPLFFAGLVPYVTVGAFFFAIMLISGIASLVLLPALIYLLRPWLSEISNNQN